ncbi:Cysteine protease atg4 [Coemansia sp. Benny D115]|nr:Cysteine protease atg4 [Coemansia sp. Benny D115]
MTVVGDSTLVTGPSDADAETVSSVLTADHNTEARPQPQQLPKAPSITDSEHPVEAAPDLSGLTIQVVNTLREWYVLASDSISSLLEGRLLHQPARDLWILGKHYELGEPLADQLPAWSGGYPPEVLADFARLIWCTYRSQYPPIAPSAFTTDAGWGCMLRAGQTLLAQALQLHYFGRDWAFSWDSELAEDVQRRRAYISIVKQFFDDYSPSSLFSIHRMASLGRQVEGKDIGQWFGPYGTATILRTLAQRADHDLAIYTTTDGTVYLADICEPDFRPTLILVATMLGIDRVNPVYYPFIQASLTLPQSAGIAGGRPSSALYFAGFQGDELLYLDPHFTRPAVVQRQDDHYEQSDLASYSCTTPRRIPLSRLDPCMVFGFYCGSLESLVDLRSRIDLLVDEGMTTIVTFDNGHAPSSEMDGSTSSLPAKKSKDVTPRPSSRTESSGLLVKLPPSPSPNDSDAMVNVDVGSSSNSSNSSNRNHGVMSEDDGEEGGDKGRVFQSDSSEIVLEETDGDEKEDEDEWVTEL